MADEYEALYEAAYAAAYKASGFASSRRDPPRAGGAVIREHVEAKLADRDRTIAEKDAEIERVREALVRYGDRIRMANAPAHLQETIDAALAEGSTNAQPDAE